MSFNPEHCPPDLVLNQPEPPSEPSVEPVRVTIEQVNQAKEADADCWTEWLRTIHPDDRVYMTYNNWLAWQLVQARAAQGKDTQ